jgi:hypothetical protein
MTRPPLAIVIATHQRSQLLHRTLTSLAACRLPANLRRVLVVENGAVSGAAEVVPQFAYRLPVEYLYSPPPCKSAALNEGLARCEGAFVVFFDDDVRVHPDTLMAYTQAAANRTNGLFIGGRCEVDYEREPPHWLKAYLPLSAKGWSRGDRPGLLDVPEALGFNWGAFASDLRATGGFDIHHGPGNSLSLGEETTVQEALLHRGVKGLYLPEARVWHYVPHERCTPEWALRRARTMGMFAGSRCARLPRGHRWRLEVACLLRLVCLSVVATTLFRWWSAERRFHYEHRRHWRRGMHEGLHVMPH